MLTSQTSSSSVSSLLSTKNDKERSHPCDYPEKFKQNCVFSRKVFFDIDDCVMLIVTSLLELIECKEDEVVNYIDLKCHCDAVRDKVGTKDVDFEVMLKDTGTVYALKIQSILFGIERNSSQLKLLKTISNVHSFKCQFDDASCEMVVQVTFSNRDEILTSFQDDEIEDFMRNKESPIFAEVFESARQISETARSHLNTLTKDIEDMSLLFYGRTRTIPKLMLDDVSEGREGKPTEGFIFCSFQGS